MVGVLLDDARRVLIRVERVHEDERNVYVVMRVEMLSLRQEASRAEE